MWQGFEPFMENALVMIEACSFSCQNLLLFSGIFWYSRAMWPYPWGCYPSAERPLTPTLWNHQGQCGEQVQGHYPGYPNVPQVPLQGGQNPSTIAEENNPTTFPPTPPTAPTGHFSKASPLFNLPPGRELQSPDLVTLMGQSPTGACHPGSDPPMIRPPVTRAMVEPRPVYSCSGLPKNAFENLHIMA